MKQSHPPLPQLDPTHLFLTDGGLETTLVYQEGIELPDFAAFTLLRNTDGRETLARYYRRYLDIAVQHRTGFILESPTWRANTDWGRRLGYTETDLAAVNRQSIALMEALRAEYAPRITAPILISGCIGPRGDGYVAGHAQSREDAERYHLPQLRTLATTAVDLVTAITMTNTEEAIGIARAARRVGLPCAISFTLETDGRLPNGETLGEAIARVDTATDGYPAYYLINCAHPSHFIDALAPDAGYLGRIRGVRANASCRSHAELDVATELDAGDPQRLAWDHLALLSRLPRLNILGGCCGTDHRHVAAIADAAAPLFTAPVRLSEHAVTLGLGMVTLGLGALLVHWLDAAFRVAVWS